MQKKMESRQQVFGHSDQLKTKKLASEKVEATCLNSESALPADNSANQAASACLSDCDLQLPYSHLKTPGTPYQQACVQFNLDGTQLSPLGSEQQQQSGDQWSLLVAAVGFIISKYSGQSQLPLCLKLDTNWIKLPDHEYLLDFNADELFESVRKSIKAQCEKVQRDFSPGQPSFAENELTSPLRLICHDIAQENISVQEWTEQTRQHLSQQDEYNDLCITIVKKQDSLSVALIFNEQIFHLKTLESMAGNLRSLIIQTPKLVDRAISKIDFLSESEKNWLNTFGDGGQCQYPQTPLHFEIEKLALNQPSHPAIKYENKTLSYSELNANANQLAHYLIERGIKPGSRILVFVEPGFEIAISLLAILKYNCTYVPLDPSFPKNRLKTIIDDICPSIAITQSHLMELLDFDKKKTIAIDKISQQLSEQPTENFKLDYDLKQTAYIYYTSGTTGKPKGILANHYNLINYIRSAQEKYAINNQDIMASCARYTFSINMFELMFPLSHGATLQILKREHILNVEHMAKTLQEITFLHMGPSLLKLLLNFVKSNYQEYSSFKKLRHLSSGGDMIPPEVLQIARQLFPHAELFVIYGCSEISCMGCTWPVPTEGAIEKTFVGKPFSNTHVIVLDDYDKPVPIGVTGNVCFAGDGIVTGYLNNLKLTQEKFIQHDGKRFYRTGDRGKISYQGQLELVGRSDFQIQLRGMRIEPGEIEYHVKQVDGVRDAIAALKAVGNTDKTLVAYYVTEQGADTDSNKISEKIREYLRNNIPDYMVPSLFVRLEALPLNHNLKVDRNALPDPGEVDRSVSSSSGTKPQTDIEKQLAKIWCDVLRLKDVFLEDNFLDIGGDSLLAVDMIARVKSTLGVSLYGLDVARECLGVLANICQTDKHQEQASELPVKTITINPTESFYFGDEKSLYGTYHRPVKNESGAINTAVLICPPVGQEHVRCNYFLKNMATKLAASGHPVLRFDYFGCGDSLGVDYQATIQRWQQDQNLALSELSVRSGFDNFVVLGVRLGATIAASAFSESHLEKLILWDPVVNGTEYLNQQQVNQKELIKELRFLKLFSKIKRNPHLNQFIGFNYSKQLLKEITSIDISQCQLNHHKQVALLKTSESIQNSIEYENFVGNLDQSKVVELTENCHWTDYQKTENALTNHQILSELINLITDQPE
ncbi:non-ribosomal peptide synthetase [Aliikangiella coralliicola]|uniref:Amino acid adenylation domain-containing protein n=1 Tax=Aliikangiella coralliicola TaxID=2592383 RepID=A0A545U588_9GAMM|nr:amino acid adenylation domain-containing protein [Aliikangiella coralliicola]TQV84573.1 amino acid adenylation domain-containing protein [Aliikangiella coralliicola]